MFLGRDVNEYHPVSFRHILISADDLDLDGAYSTEEVEAARTQAQSIYDEWLAGDATEESFAELANTHSTDTGSNTSGGLYENVAKDQMVPAINDWLFEEGRKPGDTIVVTNEGSYTGAHVVYFVGEEETTYADYLSDTALRSQDSSEWITELKSGVEVVRNHLNRCGKAH